MGGSKPLSNPDGLPVDQQMEASRVIGKTGRIFKEGCKITHGRRLSARDNFTKGEQVQEKIASSELAVFSFNSLEQLGGASSTRLHEGFCDFHNLPALAGLGLIPDRPDGLRIGRVSHQQACHIRL